MPPTLGDLHSADAARDAAFEQGNSTTVETPTGSEVAASGHDEDDILSSFADGEDSAAAATTTEEEIAAPEVGEAAEVEDDLTPDVEEGLPAGEEEAPTPEEEAAAAAAAQKTPEQIAAEQQEQKTLGSVYQQYPQLKEFLKTNPAMRPFFFKAAELNKVFLTPADAQKARQYAEDFLVWDSLYFSDNPDDTRQFLKSLSINSQDSSGQSRGYYERMSKMVTHDTISNLDQVVNQTPELGPAIGKMLGFKDLTHGQVKTAMRIVNALMQLSRADEGEEVYQTDATGEARYRAPSSESRDEVRQLMAENQRLQQLLEGTTQEQFDHSVKTEFRGWLDGAVEKLLVKATALEKQPATYKTYLGVSIRDGVISAIKSDQFFSSSVMAAARSGGRDPEHRKQLVSMLEQRARAHFPEVARKVLGEAGIKLVAQKKAAAAANAGRPRPGKEPSGQGGPGRLRTPAQGSPNKPKSGETYSQYADRLLEI